MRNAFIFLANPSISLSTPSLSLSTPSISLSHFFHIPYQSSLLPLARLLAPFLTESVRLDGDYNVFYHSLVSSKNLGAPTSAYIGQGLAGKGGSKVLDVVGANATWQNITPAKAPFYSYTINGTWLKTSTLSASNGQTVRSVIDAIVLAPNSSYYAGITTRAFSKRAARGQIIVKLPDAGPNNNNGVADGGNKTTETLVGVVEARLNGSNAGLAAATNSSGSLSLAVFHLSSSPPFSPQYLYAPLPSPLTLSPSPATPHSPLTFFQSHTANCGPSIRTCPSSAQCLSLLVPPCPSLSLLVPPRPSLPLLAPPCLSLPLLVLLAPPRPSLATLPLSNTTTNNDDILYSDAPTRVAIMKGADVALTVATSSTTWTNRTLTPSAPDPDPTDEICKTISAESCFKLKAQYQIYQAQHPPPPPPPFPGYTYETAGTWLSASTLKADNGQTYKDLVNAMLAAPGAYSALVFAIVEAGAASGAFANSTLTAGNGTVAGGQAAKLSIKLFGWRTYPGYGSRYP
ncbi:unnamed protein product [Closterium sp. Naga37s-1]|nr:unnamed protein product [Closterium sp. Naga37s-1]